MPSTTLRRLAMAALFVGSTAGASTVEHSLFAALDTKPMPKATCSCKGPNDCTCPKDKCKCKGCGKKVMESLKGSTETTRLPETARSEARGGIFI